MRCRPQPRERHELVLAQEVITPMRPHMLPFEQWDSYVQHHNPGLEPTYTSGRKSDLRMISN